MVSIFSNEVFLIKVYTGHATAYLTHYYSVTITFICTGNHATYFIAISLDCGGLEPNLLYLWGMPVFPLWTWRPWSVSLNQKMCGLIKFHIRMQTFCVVFFRISPFPIGSNWADQFFLALASPIMKLCIYQFLSFNPCIRQKQSDITSIMFRTHR